MRISSRNSKAHSRTSKRSGNDFGLTSDGKYAGHTAPDQIDPQHRANHEGDADGRSVENAPRPTARSRRPPVCRGDEQGARFPAKTDRSDLASVASDSRGKEGAGLNNQHRQRLGWRAQHKSL